MIGTHPAAARGAAGRSPPGAALRADRGLALERSYFVVVAGFTLWVGWFGFLRPQEILRALPWPMPPLHARFVGALYLAATVFLLLSALARTRLQTRSILDIAGVWTGCLLLVTVLQWRQFDLARVQVWYWVGAYVAFPLAAAGLRRAAPPVAVPASARMRQAWVPRVLQVQGTALVVLAALLLVWPGSAQHFWPWKITPLLAQVYAGPVAAFGVGSLLLARRRNWPEARLPLLGQATFAGLALAASCWHWPLFTPGSPSRVIWFCTLALLAAVPVALGLCALRPSAASSRRSTSRVQGRS